MLYLVNRSGHPESRKYRLGRAIHKENKERQSGDGKDFTLPEEVCQGNRERYVHEYTELRGKGCGGGKRRGMGGSFRQRGMQNHYEKVAGNHNKEFALSHQKKGSKNSGKRGRGILTGMRPFPKSTRKKGV